MFYLYLRQFTVNRREGVITIKSECPFIVFYCLSSAQANSIIIHGQNHIDVIKKGLLSYALLIKKFVPNKTFLVLVWSTDISQWGLNIICLGHLIYNIKVIVFLFNVINGVLEKNLDKIDFVL